MSSSLDIKRKKEKNIIALMIGLYCVGNHSKKKKESGDKNIELCDKCKELLEYAEERIDRCPFADTKTFCSSCKVHCYKSEMREQIRRVMKYAGPRMLFHHPLMAMSHVMDTIKNKKRRNN